MIVHEGVIYPCPECEYKSGRKDTLKRHVMKVHGQDLNISYFGTLDLPEPEIATRKVLYQEEKRTSQVVKEDVTQYETIKRSCCHVWFQIDFKKGHSCIIFT